MPLALEHLPTRLRGGAAGILQGAFTWGFILSALAFHFVYPLIHTRPDFAWRVMFWIGALPAMFVLWIRARVKESPVWLERSRAGVETREGLSLMRIFRGDLVGTTIHASIVAAGFMVSYQSVVYWYATFLRSRQLDTLPYIVTLSVGGIAGSAFWGWVSQGWPGRRGAVTMAALIGIAMAPVYLMSEDPRLLLLGALLVGFGAHGMWGAFPAYLSERFPSAVRGAGAGFCYHAGSLVGSVTPSAIGYLTVRGMPLPTAMTLAIAVSGLALAGIIWLGPETRDRAL